MKSLAAEQIKVARILLNLGHSYLHSTSLENSEDEEEEGEENEEQEEEEEEKEEIDDNKEETDVGIEQQLNAQKKNVGEIKGEKFTSKQFNIEKEGREIQIYPDKVKREIKLEFDNRYNESLQQENFLSKIKQEFIEDKSIIFNKNKQNKLYKCRNIEIDRAVQEAKKDVQQILQESNRNTLQNFDRINQHDLAGENEIVLDMKMQVDSKYLQEFNETLHKELNDKQQMLKQNKEEVLFIEMEVKCELQQGLDRKVKEILNGDTEFDIGIEMHLNKNVTRKSDKKKQINTENDQKLSEGAILKYNIINMKHNFENEIKNKSNENIDFYEETINTILDICNKNIQNNSNYQQEFNVKIKERTQDNDIDNKRIRQIGFNEKVLEEIYKKKQRVEYIFDSKNQPLLNKKVRNELKEQFNINEKVHMKCNGEVLDNCYKEKPIIVLCNKPIQFDEKTEHLLCNKIQEKFNENPEMFVKDIHFIFNGELLIECDKMKQLGTNYVIEYDNKNIKFSNAKIQQEIEEDILDKINLKTSMQVDVGCQLELHKNVQFLEKLQNRLNKYEQETFYKEVKCDNEFLFISEPKTHKIIHERLVETFNIQIQNKINTVMRDIIIQYHKVNDEIQQLLNGKANHKLIELIKQEIEELYKEIEELYEDQDEELETEIIENINKMYSLQPTFLDKLILLLYQDSIPLNKRVEELYNLYIPNVDNQHKNYSHKTQFGKKIQQTFNKELPYRCNKNKLKKINLINLREHKKTQEIQTFASEIQHEVSEDKIKKVVNDIELKFHNIIKEIEREMEIDLKRKIQMDFGDQVNQIPKTKIHIYADEYVKKHQELEKNLDENMEELMAKKVMYQYFNIVIKLNKEIQKIKNDKIQQAVIKKKVVNYKDKIRKECIKKTKWKVDKNKKTFRKPVVKLQLNDTIHKTIKNKTKHVDINMHQKFDREFYNKFNENIKLVTMEDINLEFCDQIKFQRELCETFQGKINERVLDELMSKIKEKVEIDSEIQIKIKKHVQHLDKELKKLINDKIHLKLEFYKKNPKIEEKFQEELTHNEIDMDQELFKIKLLNKSEKVKKLSPKKKDNLDLFKGDNKYCILEKSELVIDKLVKAIQGKAKEESNVSNDEFNDKVQEKFEEEIKKNCVNINKMTIDVQKEYETDIDKESDIETEEEFEIKKGEESEVDIEELSDVEIEDSYKKTKDYPKVIQEEEHDGSEIDIKEYKNEFNVEVNKVNEEFEDKSTSSDDSCIFIDGESYPKEEYNCTKEEFSSTEELCSTIEELSSTDEEFSSTEEREKIETQQNIYTKDLQMFERDTQEIINKQIHQELDTEVQQEYHNKLQHNSKESQVKLVEKKSKNFEDLLQMKIENIEDLDEIPLELKIQQEQFEEKLHKQFKQFQKEFYKNSKVEYDKERLLKVNKPFNPELLHLFDEQQQIFYELKDEFHEIKQEYKGFVQQKIFEEIQREIDEKLLLEIDQFPEEVNTKLNLKFDEDIHKEFVKLQRDCSELEPEFKYNVPLEFEEDLNQLLELKPINIFDTLQYVHKQKLCDFVDSKQWPDNCLYPSSLLDSLFEKPFEITPNVLIITLYSIEVGYSIKLSMDKNQSPVEIFFNYAEDLILEYVEKEQLPPHLLDLLDRAEPRLFYCGCVIAEIHNKTNGILSELYRILLRPFNMSIQNDLSQILAENSNIDWSYKKRLQLESMLLLISHPIMCMDSSPIAGLTVNLQHQMLSCRSMNLNPLKKKYTPSKLKPLELNLTDGLKDYQTSEFSKKEHRIIFKSMDSSDNVIHYITWKFDFRIKSFKLMRLYVIVKEPLEYSILLCINPKVEFVMRIRFKINIEKNKLKIYINVIQQILKQKISPDILVVRRFKSNDKLPPQPITCVPILFSDNIYEPSHTDINQLINMLLDNRLEYLCDKIEFELKTNNYMVSSINMTDDKQNIENTKESKTQNIENTKESTRIIKVDDNIKKNINLFRLNILSKNTSTENLRILSKNIKENETQNIQPENKSFFNRVKLLSTKPIKACSSPLKSPTRPINFDLDLSTGLPIKEKPIIKNKNVYIKPSMKSPTLINLLDNKEKSNLISTPNINTDILPISNPLIVASSVSSLTDRGPLVSSVSVTKPLTVISPLSRIVSELSSVSRQKEVLKASNVLQTLSEPISTDCKLVDRNLFLPTDKNKLLKLLNHSVNIDANLKPVVLSKSKHLKYLNKGNLTINVLSDVKHQLPVLSNPMKTVSGITQPFYTQLTDSIPVMKHAHDTGICLNGSKIVVNKAIPQIAILTQKTSLVNPVLTTDLQLDRRKEKHKLDDILNTVVVSSSNFQVTLQNDIVPLKPLSLSQSNSRDEINTEAKINSSNDSLKYQTLNNMKSFIVETISSKNNLTNNDAFQEINNTASLNIEGYKRIKRKRTTS